MSLMSQAFKLVALYETINDNRYTPSVDVYIIQPIKESKSTNFDIDPL